jgi:Flp pilus assembly protein TadD
MRKPQALSTLRPRTLVGAALAFGALTWFLYSEALQGPFVYDDVVIEACQTCRPERLSGVWDVIPARGVPRKVTMMSFALSHYAGGPDARGYHAANLVLHALVATALFAFAARLLALLPAAGAWTAWAIPISAAGAVAWLVHPVQTQAVAYVWQRSTELSALFFLCSLLAYLEARWGGRGPRRLLFAASALLAVLALGSKENAGTLPLFVILLELAFRDPGDRLAPRLAVRFALLGAAFLAVAAFYLGPRFPSLMAGAYERRGFTLGERLLTELRVIGRYLSLLVLPLPSRLNLDYDFPLSRSLLAPPSTLACLVLIAALLAVAAWQFDRRRLLSLAILWFFGALVIESTVIPLELIYEHRLYVPSMLPIVLLTGLAVSRRAAHPRLLWAGITAVLFLLATATIARVHVWADAVRLFEDTARKSPRKARVHANLGLAYMDKRDFAGAERALRRALALDPEQIGVANNLALIQLDHLHQPGEARRLLEETLRRKPDESGTRVNLAVACGRLGDWNEAVRQLEAAEALDPGDPRIAHNLAVALLAKGDAAAATTTLERAVVAWPQDLGLRRLLASVRAASVSR